MDSLDNNLIRLVSERFREEWEPGSSIKISEFLAEVPQPESARLMELLVSIDIEKRIEQGERPEANDYIPLGPAVFTVALNELENRFRKRFGEPVAEPPQETIADFGGADSWKDEFEENRPPSSEVRENKLIDERYVLIEQIGRGGMGTVWLADQIKPLKRRVAIKFIRPDIAASEIAMARFDAERQAIAKMTHPNIAKVLEAGRSDSGGPYFVMEWVDGIPLDRYCDLKKLNIRQRIELMLPVCNAVQHAHQKGVLHRDLKPSNVLVVEHDGVAMPMVIDFGLAKALENAQPLNEQKIIEHNKIVGTLHYMSPEQASKGKVDVDTRSDVYSLGVMIYKLLTGVTPHQGNEQGDFTMFSALEQILSFEPQRPSTKLSSPETAVESISESRSSNPSRLIRSIEGDLDFVVMKAIMKDRAERYQTANGLALDLERFLTDNEVLARPSTIGYRVNKFVKRNRGLVAALSTIVALLVVGIVGTTLASIWALNQTKLANEKTLIAEKSEELSAAQLLSLRLKSASSNWYLGDPKTALEDLNRVESRGWEARFLHNEFGSSDLSTNVMYGHARPVNSIGISPNGKLLVSGAADHTIKIWNAANRKLLKTILIRDESQIVQFSKDSKLVYFVNYFDRNTEEPDIGIIDVDKGEVIKEFGPYGKEINGFVKLPDLPLVAVAFMEVKQGSSELDESQELETSVAVVSLETGEIVQEVKAHTRKIRGLAVNPAGTQLLSCSLDGTIGSWSLNDGTLALEKYMDAHLNGVETVCFSPTGFLFASGGADKTVKLWGAEAGKSIRVLSSHTDLVTSVRFSDSGDKLVSGSDDQTAIVWDVSGNRLSVMRGHFKGVNDAAFSKDGNRIYTVSDDLLFRYWQIGGQQSTVVSRQHTGVIWAAAFSPDSDSVVVASEDYAISHLNADTGELIGQKIQLNCPVTSVAFGADSAFFVSGDEWGSLKVWDSKTHELIKEIQAHDNVVWDCSFSFDGKLLATSSSDKTSKVWDTDSWEPVATLKKHSGEVGSTRFSNDNKFLVTSGDDKLIIVWDAKTYKPIRTLTGHNNQVWRAMFSPTGDLIASSSYDGELILWDAKSGEVVHRNPEAHLNQIAGLAFTKDGSRVVTASDDGLLKIWDVKTGVDLFVFNDADNKEQVHVSFSPDGEKMIAGNGIGLVTIRSATKIGEMVNAFLPQDAANLDIKGEESLLRPVEEIKLERELRVARKCCNHYPTHRSYSNLGNCQFRLGQYEEAIESLLEARRLEIIQYPGDALDIRPRIDGFLALAYWETGQFEKALQRIGRFSQIFREYWSLDEATIRLKEELESTCFTAQFGL